MNFTGDCMAERYQLSSHVLGDTDEARYDAHYAGEAPVLVASLVILPILPSFTV